MFTNSRNDLIKRLCNVIDKRSQQVGEIISKAENGEPDAVKAIAYIFEHNSESDNQIRAFMLYKKANELFKGDPSIIVRLASCYYNGIGVDKNIAKGLSLYREAAAYGEPETCYLFACKLKENNDPECIEQLESIYINRGIMSPHAAYDLAFIYKDGIICPQDLSKYLDYLWKSAEIGCSDAYSQLLKIHNEKYSDHSSSEVTRESILFLERLANVGSAKAAEKLAELYINGEYTEKNTAAAIKWAGEAAKNGDADFTYEFQDQFDSIDDKKQCIGLAAHYNNARALFELGVSYEIGNDTDNAKLCYICALDNNNPTALLSLKYMLCSIQKNEQEFFRIIMSSADSGSAAAALGLHNLYLKGLYTEKDKVKAEEYLERALNDEYPAAFYTVGCYYENGEFGYPKDVEMAFLL